MKFFISLDIASHELDLCTCVLHMLYHSVQEREYLMVPDLICLTMIYFYVSGILLHKRGIGYGLLLFYFISVGWLRTV